MEFRCHNCGSVQAQHLFTAPAFDPEPAQSYPVLRCASCQLVNTDLGGASIGAADYNPDYYGSSSSKFSVWIEAILGKAARRRAREILALWRGSRPGQQQPSVLDIGCGRAVLLRAFQAEGAAVLGLERTEFPMDEELASIVRVGEIGGEEFRERCFDIVILWHVLEHMEAHEDLLAEITGHLQADGLLVLAVPNFGGLQQRLFGKYWFHLDLPRHLVHIDAQWLREQLTRRGYTIERESHLDIIQNVYGFIQSGMNALFPARPNAFYRLLKHRRQSTPASLLPLLGWSCLALLLAPFALLDALLGSCLRRGATVKVYARRDGKNDQ
ncbi:MAG: methyltransferase domain-containing protein [Halieaceae bacterium]